MKRTKKKCQMLLAGLLTLMMVFTMWSPHMVYADDDSKLITTDDIPGLYNVILSKLDIQPDEFTVSKAKEVTNLHLAVYPASSIDLTGMGVFSNLESFGISLSTAIESDNGLARITGTEALAGMENLKYVSFTGSTIESLSGLPDNIESLSLNGKIGSIPGLSQMKNLKSLYLKASFTDSDSVMEDISKLTNLEELTVWGTGIKMSNNISALAGLTNLKSLTVRSNGITDVSAFSGLTGLEELKLWDNQISDVSALAGLTNLKTLDLSGNNITNFRVLQALEENGTNVIKGRQTVSVSGSATVNGSGVTVTMETIDNAYSNLTSEQQTAIDKVSVTSAEMQKELIKDTAGIEVSTVKYYKLLDISLPSGTDISAGAVITLKDDSIKAGMNIVMLHLKADGTWENIPVIVADGAITGTFTSLSPVYYFAVEEGTGTGSGSGSGENTGSGEGTGTGSGSVSVSTKYEPAEITFTGSNGKAMRWISSEKDGNISISGLQTVIADGAKFYAEKVKSTAIANAVAEAKGDVPYVAYDFTLTVDGEEVTTFAEHVDVSMPVPDGFDLGEGQTVTVYYYNNGKLEKCNTAVSDGFVTFGTTHFSTFVYVQESAASAASTPAVSYTVSPKTGENDMVLYMAVLAVAVFGGMVYCLNKRRSY